MATTTAHLAGGLHADSGGYARSPIDASFTVDEFTNFVRLAYSSQVSESLEVILSDADNVFARQGMLLVQVRRGSITVPTLDRIGAEVRRLLTTHRGPTAFISVLEPTAETVSLAVRERQRLIVAATETMGDVKMALLVIGDGIQASLSRSIARALLHRNKRLKVAHDVGDAAHWVSPHIEQPVFDIVATVQTCRRMAV